MDIKIVGLDFEKWNGNWKIDKIDYGERSDPWIRKFVLNSLKVPVPRSGLIYLMPMKKVISVEGIPDSKKVKFQSLSHIRFFPFLRSHTYPIHCIQYTEQIQFLILVSCQRCSLSSCGGAITFRWIECSECDYHIVISVGSKTNLSSRMNRLRSIMSQVVKYHWVIPWSHRLISRIMEIMRIVHQVIRPKCSSGKRLTYRKKQLKIWKIHTAGFPDAVWFSEFLLFRLRNNLGRFL